MPAGAERQETGTVVYKYGSVGLPLSRRKGVPSPACPAAVNEDL